MFKPAKPFLPMACSHVAMLLLSILPLAAGANDQTVPVVTDADWASYNNGVRGWRFNAAEKN